MDYTSIYESNHRHLWGLCYRMTGSAADAEDLVQDTFVRAMENPPPRTEEPWRPWLVKVALNLSRDHLRHRQSRAYVGPWLPSPIDTGDDHVAPAVEPVVDGQGTEARYELLESVSFAFLLALEALSPTQRAVLLLRDVFDYSVKDAAEALDLSEANVKTTLHRAREAMERYDRSRQIPTREAQERNQQVLAEFLGAMVNQDVAKMESMLSAEVRALSDGGGQYYAALNPILGIAKVCRFFTKLTARRGGKATIDFRMFNGMPAVVVEIPDGEERDAPVFVFRCDLGPDGKISEFHSVLSGDKLLGLRL